MDILRTFVYFFCQVLTLIIVARAILSWIAPNPYEQPMRFLYEVTEPVLSPIRRIIPRIGMIDLAPMVLVIILQIICELVRRAG